MKAHFSRHGIPEQLVTDNGSQFVPRDFVKFAKEWDFEHFTNSPRHSQANGKAESAVKEAKKIIMKCKKSGTDTFLALLDHRNTPPAIVQISPAQRLFSRRTRSLLPMSAELLKPSLADDDVTQLKLRLRQQQQAWYYNRGARDFPPLEEDDSVRIKSWQLGKKEWQPGSVRKRLDERSYEVQTPCGILRRNRIHLRKSTSKDDVQPSQSLVTASSTEPITLTPSIKPEVEPNLSSTTPPKIPQSQANEQETTRSGHTENRRSQRLRRLPTHLKDFVLK